MALAARTTKPGSTTSFTESFGLGNTLQIADLDGDLNAVVAAVNAIDDSQVATAANIDGAKLLNASIATGKLADSAVTNAKIASMAASKLTGTIALAQLAVGASIAGFGLATNETGGVLAEAESVIGEVNLSSVRGSLLLVFASFTGHFRSTTTNAPDPNFAYQLRLREAGSAGIADGTVRRTGGGLIPLGFLDFTGTGTWNASQHIPVYGTLLYAVQPAVSTRWKFTAAFDNGTVNNGVLTEVSSYLLVVELA